MQIRSFVFVFLCVAKDKRVLTLSLSRCSDRALNEIFFELVGWLEVWFPACMK